MLLVGPVKLRRLPHLKRFMGKIIVNTLFFS